MAGWLSLSLFDSDFLEDLILQKFVYGLNVRRAQVKLNMRLDQVCNAHLIISFEIVQQKKRKILSLRK